MAEDGAHQPMPHQAYGKAANYADGYYSPWPEGTPDFDRMFFLLTGLKVEEQESGEVYITVQATEYYFYTLESCPNSSFLCQTKLS